jgi:hypothetical protein
MRSRLIFVEQSLALMEKECHTAIEVMEASTDNMAKSTIVELRSTIMSIRQTIGTARRSRERIHGLITAMLIEDEYNGTRDKATAQADRDCNSDTWIDARFNIPEEEKE